METPDNLNAPAAVAGEPSKPDASHPPTRKGGKRTVISILMLGLLSVLVLAWMKHSRAAAQASTAPGGGREGGGGAGGRRGAGQGPVAVVAGTVTAKDVPIYLDGLGTVQAFNTVTVRSRVDGQVQHIQFIEGQDVHTGDVLAQIDPAPFQTQLDQNKAKKAQDEAQLAVARLTLERDGKLLADKILSQQDYDTQKASVEQYEAAVKADQATIDNAKVQLDYTTIVSPIDGRTGLRLVDQGNIVHATDPNGIVVITQLRPISVVFTLPEKDLRDIQARLTAGGPLTVLAVEKNNQTVCGEGKLAVVDNQIDTSTATIRLKATFPNDDLRLWPGQFVNARLLVDTRKDATVVPTQVVQRGPDGTYAFVIQSNQTVAIRPIKVREAEAGESLVEAGLRPGESVVVDGQYKLQAGSRVKLSQSVKEPGGEAGE